MRYRAPAVSPGESAVQWRDAVLNSLREFANRHRTRTVERQQFIAEELPSIASTTSSTGSTPSQTLSRVLQELRDSGYIQFLDRGYYLLLDQLIDVDFEELTDEALDFALQANKLRLGYVETDNQVCLARRRKGQSRLRKLVMEYYGRQCAACDVKDGRLLVASHIATWSDAPQHRGDLTNVICLCRVHDSLFEFGYWALDDDFHIIKARSNGSSLIQILLDNMMSFRLPTHFAPGTRFIQQHRAKANLK
jgi:hypothetical protein